MTPVVFVGQIRQFLFLTPRVQMLLLEHYPLLGLWPLYLWPCLYGDCLVLELEIWAKVLPVVVLVRRSSLDAQRIEVLCEGTALLFIRWIPELFGSFADCDRTIVVLMILHAG